jgi:SAM-dependent methyltransferase
MNCNLCHCHDLHRVADHDAKSGRPLDVFLCNHCGLIQQVPLPCPDELKQYYTADYRLDYKGTREPKAKHILRSARQAAARLEFLKRAGVCRGTLLDIGAGSGEFVALALKAGFSATGIEPNQGYSEFARGEYSAPVATGGLEDAAGCHDVITMFHVMEHLRSPLDVFERLHSLISPQGRLFIEVPWILSGSVSPANRYFKAHLYYFDVETLGSCASRHFQMVHAETRGNLRMLLRPREEPARLDLPPMDYAAKVRALVARQGWANYLTCGHGWRKPVLKLRRIAEEHRVRRLSGSRILAAFHAADG